MERSASTLTPSIHVGPGSFGRSCERADEQQHPPRERGNDTEGMNAERNAKRSGRHEIFLACDAPS